MSSFPWWHSLKSWQHWAWNCPPSQRSGSVISTAKEVCREYLVADYQWTRKCTSCKNCAPQEPIRSDIRVYNIQSCNGANWSGNAWGNAERQQESSEKAHWGGNAGQEPRSIAIQLVPFLWSFAKPIESIPECVNYLACHKFTWINISSSDEEPI